MRDRNPPKYERENLNDLVQDKEQIVLHRTHFESLTELDKKLYMVAENYYDACNLHSAIDKQQVLPLINFIGTTNDYFAFCTSTH